MSDMRWDDALENLTLSVTMALAGPTPTGSTSEVPDTAKSTLSASARTSATPAQLGTIR